MFHDSRKTNTMSRQPNVNYHPESSDGHLWCKGREPWEGFPGEEATCPATFFPTNNTHCSSKSSSRRHMAPTPSYLLAASHQLVLTPFTTSHWVQLSSQIFPVDSAPIWAQSSQLLQENALGNGVKGLTKVHINNTHSLFRIHWSPCHRRRSGWSRGAALHKVAWSPPCPACGTGRHSGWSVPSTDIPQYLGQANRPVVLHILLPSLLVDRYHNV